MIERSLSRELQRLRLSSPRRLLGLLGSLALVALLVPLVSVLQGAAGPLDPSAPLLFLVPVLLASAISGRVAGVLVSCVAALVWAWYFIPPLYNVRSLGDRHDVVALVVFVAVALLV